MYKQNPKTEIDVGTIGNASTGDILFDGGGKINSNMTALYNAFGDQRFFEAKTETLNQKIHATGYWQKVNQYAFTSPVEMGSQWDVDTTTGGASPFLPAGIVGECVSFINSNGSISIDRPLVINPQSGSSFVGIRGGLRITQPFCKVDCWCISVENGVSIWNYSISSLFGSREVPVEKIVSLDNTGTKIYLASSAEYNSMKLLLTVSSTDNTKLRMSEVNLLIDNRLKNVHDTEFAVLRVNDVNPTKEIVSIKYDLDSSGNLSMTVIPEYQNLRIAVKSIATQRVGSA